MPHRLKLKLWTTTQREREEDRDRLGFSFPGGCDIMLRYRPEEVRHMERGWLLPFLVAVLSTLLAIGLNGGAAWLRRRIRGGTYENH